ncbi:hypothetical protein CLOM_g5514 [Closterium sp. NIES-68]|nr:hypothetical protein CLOM_g5514 [Closterium sp. NIES-68]GJP73979.1 hypothetical protein CLOP_g4638 [Closterium sp. NIES-67]
MDASAQACRRRVVPPSPRPSASSQVPPISNYFTAPSLASSPRSRLFPPTTPHRAGISPPPLSRVVAVADDPEVPPGSLAMPPVTRRAPRTGRRPSIALGIARPNARVTAAGRALLVAVLASAAVACLAAPAAVASWGAACVNGFPKRALCRFVDDLAATPLVTVDGATGSAVTIGAFQKRIFHRDLPASKVYVYGVDEQSASYPGPMIVATRHTPTTVRWENHLSDQQHMLGVDYSLPHVASPAKGGIPMSPHLHGAETPSDSDGHPHAWFTQHGDSGSAFASSTSTYPNSQPPALLWFHDHAMGLTRLNVAAGLAGLYLIKDPGGVEQPMAGWLPSGEFDVPLVLADRKFRRDGRVVYSGMRMGMGGGGLSMKMEYLGNVNVVNGKVWPFLSVKPRLYRLRLLGAANARVYRLHFQCAAHSDYPHLLPPLHGPKLSMLQIASDGGYLAAPVRRSSVLLAPGERADVLLDLSALPSPACRHILLLNTAPAPFPSGAGGMGGMMGGPMGRVARGAGKVVGRVGRAVGRLVRRKKALGVRKAVMVVMLLTVAQEAAVAAPAVPAVLQALPAIDLSEVSQVRYLTISGMMGGMGGGMGGMGGRGRGMGELWGRREGVGSNLSAAAHQVWSSFRGRMGMGMGGGGMGGMMRFSIDGKGFMDAATEVGAVGAAEVWHIVNTGTHAHPIHIHLVQHRPLSRRPFNSAAFLKGTCALSGSSKRSCYTGNAEAVGPWESGWKDTTLALPGQVLRLFVKFTAQDGSAFPFDATAGAGYVWHCHMLEHEENDMMRPLLLTA